MPRLRIRLPYVIAAIWLALAAATLMGHEPRFQEKGQLEPVTPAATVQLKRGGLKILRSPWPIHRIATSNPSVCTAVPFSAGELGLSARNPGTSDVYIWSADASRNPIYFVIEVQ